ncbi:hypothetical protein JNO54_05525 [Janibacter sp. YIM B02568]|uniref:hypothetical protein n=1 Tax=Janibacter endophyticus TaxID=2806261 RepID=UPI00194F483B|nr:hypothetical protein [Janibacter endophyticus]MBM6545598.1 hypothetical protein [Janibacter endophyticus]
MGRQRPRASSRASTVGALFGAVLTGVIGSSNLRIGFAVPMILILGLVPLAGAFRSQLRQD